MQSEHQIQQFIDSVYEAERAVIESQANEDPARFQHAQNMIYQAKQQLLEVEELITGHQKAHHAMEYLRHLEETQHSIEATDEF
ncbi:hypothetical protein [Fredinandcohnia sp. 179-A 10B2 NHS]|uniref:hypothetical protein n=1 Tax=Fredinandcohnia sp. 179-A 10B2 NHS TaxID=3235176 RepID=UPI00399F885D